MPLIDGARQPQLKQELYEIIDTYIIEEVKVYFGMSYMGDYAEFQDNKLKELISKLKIEEYMYIPEQKNYILHLTTKGIWILL